jgi:ActR/RegA family two-component response regulator
MRDDRGLMIVEEGYASGRDPNRLFPKRGWETCLATTAIEALALLDRRLEPDSLVLLMRRPGQGGAAVLRKVREAGLSTRVAVCTGPATVEEIEDFWALRPDLMLVRPVDAEAVSEAASKVCGRSGPLRADGRQSHP